MPNSVASLTSGDDPRDGVAELATRTLARRLAPFSVGELVADDRLEMRGILVGVSFVRLVYDVLSEDCCGGSFAECGKVPTLGEPAIVGRMLRELRSDASDCFCMELTVCDVTRDVFGFQRWLGGGYCVLRIVYEVIKEIVQPGGTFV